MFIRKKKFEAIAKSIQRIESDLVELKIQVAGILDRSVETERRLDSMCLLMRTMLEAVPEDSEKADEAESLLNESLEAIFNFQPGSMRVNDG